MLKELFKSQQQYIQHYFDHLDLQAVDQVVEECLRVKGLIIFTGVGKSGIIAEKTAATLTSTGTRALYLSPTNFLHGDLGILSSDDLLVLLSRSGETQELLNLIPFAKAKGTRLLAVVSNPESRLAKHVDFFINLPFEKELCPFDLAPTTSTAVQLLFGDLLSVALMRAKRFNLAAYTLNHPSGAIGKKMTVLVDELMHQGGLPLAYPGDRLADVIEELSSKKMGALLIVSEDRGLQGIFTDGDLRRSLQRLGASALEKRVSELMTPTSLFIEKGKLAWEALQLMQQDPKKLVTVLPVLEKGKVIGVLRMHDIVQAGIS